MPKKRDQLVTGDAEIKDRDLRTEGSVDLLKSMIDLDQFSSDSIQRLRSAAPLADFANLSSRGMRSSLGALAAGGAAISSGMGQARALTHAIDSIYGAAETLSGQALQDYTQLQQLVESSLDQWSQLVNADRSVSASIEARDAQLKNQKDAVGSDSSNFLTGAAGGALGGIGGGPVGIIGGGILGGLSSLFGGKKKKDDVEDARQDDNYLPTDEEEFFQVLLDRAAGGGLGDSAREALLGLTMRGTGAAGQAAGQGALERYTQGQRALPIEDILGVIQGTTTDLKRRGRTPLRLGASDLEKPQQLNAAGRQIGIDTNTRSAEAGVPPSVAQSSPNLLEGVLGAGGNALMGWLNNRQSNASLSAQPTGLQGGFGQVALGPANARGVNLTGAPAGRIGIDEALGNIKVSPFQAPPLPF